MDGGAAFIIVETIFDTPNAKAALFVAGDFWSIHALMCQSSYLAHSWTRQAVPCQAIVVVSSDGVPNSSRPALPKPASMLTTTNLTNSATPKLRITK